MEKHFELTENFVVNVFGIKLFQIKATKKTKWADIGDIGGFVEKESNISGDAWVSRNAQVSGDARVYGNAIVSENAWVYGDARVSGNAQVSGDARVYGNAWVYGNAQVYGNARVSGNAIVSENAWVSGDAWVFVDNDLCWFSKFGSQGRTTTFFKTKTDIWVNCGCFRGTIKEFKKQVVKTHNDSKYAKEYLAMIKLVKIKFNL